MATFTRSRNNEHEDVSDFFEKETKQLLVEMKQNNSTELLSTELLGYSKSNLSHFSV